MKVCFRHTNNLCRGTLFEDDGEVFRVVETRATSGNGRVSYVSHFTYPDETLPAGAEIFESTHAEVKEWHDASRAVLAQRPHAALGVQQVSGLPKADDAATPMPKVELGSVHPLSEQLHTESWAAVRVGRAFIFFSHSSMLMN